MARWEIATYDDICGYGNCAIAPGQLRQVLDGTQRRRVRCRAHAIGRVDEGDIERAYLVAADAEIERATRVARAFGELFAKHQRPLAFDGKLAALGDDA